MINQCFPGINLPGGAARETGGCEGLNRGHGPA